MSGYPNPFTDDEIVKTKEFCRKCYKLDRIKSKCERFDAILLQRICASGQLTHFEKCDECKAFSSVR